MTVFWYAVGALLVVCSALFVGILVGSDRQAKRRPDTIAAVAAEALAERPDLADDTEAVARTVLALTDVERLRALAARDARQVAKHDVLLVEIYKAQAYSRFGDDITKDAPKERP
jgi:hypothetical protein